MSNIFNVAGSSPASGQCLVTVGSHNIKQNAPETVANLRRSVKMVYPALDNAAVCYRGTQVLAETDTVEPGQSISFMRPLGEKGQA